MFLNNLGFTKEETENFVNQTAPAMVEVLNENRKLVKANLQYLIDLGAKNYKDIFFRYYELFLMDNSNFMGIFNKYDREDLIEKLSKNIAIIEYL